MNGHEPWCSIHDPEMRCNCLPSRQAARIRELESQLADARREAAEAQAREQALRAAITKAHDSLFSQCASNPITNAWGKKVSMLEFNEAACLAISKPDNTALQSAIEAAVAEEREDCAIWLDSYDGKGCRRAEAIRSVDHQVISKMIRARNNQPKEG